MERVVHIKLLGKRCLSKGPNECRPSEKKGIIWMDSGPAGGLIHITSIARQGLVRHPSWSRSVGDKVEGVLFL